MFGLLALFRSTIGQKVLMGVTGLMLVAFIVIHLLGNLLVYSGPEAINAYGDFLQHGTHGLIWVARLGLLGAVAVHIWTAIALTRKNRQARGGRYAGGKKSNASSYAARTMRYGGVIILLFIIFHLLHLTFGALAPMAGDFKMIAGESGGHAHADVYGNLVRGFQVPVVSISYIIAMLAIGWHLYHGIWSGLYTLGLSHPQYDAMRKILSTSVALIVVIGNCSIPIAVLAGLLGVSQ